MPLTSNPSSLATDAPIERRRVLTVGTTSTLTTSTREPSTRDQPQSSEKTTRYWTAMAFTSRLAVITGGLGGIGSTIGKLLHTQGCNLALFHAPFEREKVDPVLSTVFNTSSSTSTTIRAYECDITSPTSIDTAFSALSKDIASDASSPACPSILVNAAGYISLNPLEDTPPQETIKHLHVNLLGPMLASQAFARMYFALREREMKEGRSAPPGRIINIASQAAHIALPDHSAYCASKAGLVGLTRSMASEWGGRGVTANTVSPGPVWTELGKKAWADDRVREEYLSMVPTGRLAEPEEIADIVVWLAGDGAGSVNGADFRVDGGFTAR